MKYKSEIIINLPIDQLISKLDSPENMKHWMKGLSHYEMIGEIPQGQKGAQMKLVFSKPKMEMIETIIEPGFPNYFKSRYDAPKMVNHQYHVFTEVSPIQTRWEVENEFTSSSFFLKIIMKILPGSFKKQTMKYLNAFKAFAEKGESLA